jgi:hypothetical protein
MCPQRRRVRHEAALRALTTDLVGDPMPEVYVEATVTLAAQRLVAVQVSGVRMS